MIFNRDLTFLHQLWLYRGFYASNKDAITEPLIYSMKTATLLSPFGDVFNTLWIQCHQLSKWNEPPHTEAHLLHTHENTRNSCIVAIV